MKKLMLVSLCFLLSACTVSESDFNTLQSRVLNLDTKVTAQQKALDDLTARLQTMGGVRTDQADLWSQLESMRTEMARIQGNLDEVNRAQSQSAGARTQDVDALGREIQNMKAALKAQLALDLEGTATAAATGPTATGGPVSGPVTGPVAGPGVDPAATTAQGPDAPPAVPAVPKDPATTLYETALATWREGEYAKAQGLFADFLRSYPKHSLAPNAHFWQGESFFQMKDYANAILRYEEVIRKHKNSPKYKAALLKEGIAFKELGKPKAGRERLRQLIKEFPNSTEARRAKSLLGN